MKKVFLLVILAGLFFGASSEVSAKFRLWEVRAMAGMSITSISQYDVQPSGEGLESIIVTNDKDKAEKFMALIDSANVFWNCSTRFSDGFRYGLGAEVGISTNKIHARGPVGLDGLVIYKWKLIGNGQIVADYSGSDAKKFTHRKITDSR